MHTHRHSLTHTSEHTDFDEQNTHTEKEKANNLHMYEERKKKK